MFKFSGTGGGSISISVDGAFKNKEGTVWLDCDRDGNVKFIEMNYKGKVVGNETSIANEKLEPFDAEAGSEVGKNIANIKVYDTKDLLIEQTGLAPFSFQSMKNLEVSNLKLMGMGKNMQLGKVI